MRFEVKTVNPTEHKTEIALVAVFTDGGMGKAAKALDKATKGAIKNVLKRGDLQGKAGELLLLPHTGTAAERILLVGCGEQKALTRSSYRQALQSAFRWLANKPYKKATSYLAEERVQDTNAERKAAINSELCQVANYRFTQMKSTREDLEGALNVLTIAADSSANAAAAKIGAKQGAATGAGMNLMRDLANLPGNVCTPTYLAKQARALAKGSKNLSCKVLSEADMRKLGMDSLLSVTAGSAEPAHFIIMEYKGAAASKKPVVLVGKGITFDTGGISLKPPATMDEMKFDMSGAASVFGTFKTLIELNPKLNVVGLIPAAENMPGGKATKPGDIVTSMAGLTIEILNTDAEGRLVLCDALTYSRKFKPAAVIDVATLTGACVIALGSHHTGLLSTSDTLSESLLKAGIAADDLAWRLPMSEDYSNQLKSNFADFANIGGREAGTITAACFLGKFTEGLNWAHLDIAGTAYKGGADKGSTGRPVPLLVEFLLSDKV